MTLASMGVTFFKKKKKFFSFFLERKGRELKLLMEKHTSMGQHGVAMCTSAVNRLQLETDLELCMWNQLNMIRLQLGG